MIECLMADRQLLLLLLRGFKNIFQVACKWSRPVHWCFKSRKISFETFRNVQEMKLRSIFRAQLHGSGAIFPGLIYLTSIAKNVLKTALQQIIRGIDEQTLNRSIASFSCLVLSIDHLFSLPKLLFYYLWACKEAVQ